MSLTQIETMLSLTVVECGSCNINFAAPESFVRKRKQEGTKFYCPKGCHISYCDSENDKLKKKLERETAKLDREKAKLEREREWHEATNRRLSATKGVVTRFKNRIARGVCPCCKRHFDKLQAHMETKHPNYVNHQEA